MLQQILALFFVLSLLGGALFLLRKKGVTQFAGFPRRGAKGAGEIRLLDRMPLGPQHSLVLVNVSDQLILVGVSPSGCNRIAAFNRRITMPNGEIECGS